LIAGQLRIPAGKAASAAGVQSWAAPLRGADRHGSQGGLPAVEYQTIPIGKERADYCELGDQQPAGNVVTIQGSRG